MPKGGKKIPVVEDRNWLYQRAVVERLSVPKIARLAGCGTWKVHNRLRRFGIPRNPVGYNLSSAGTDNIMAQPGAVNPFAGKCHTDSTRRRLSQKASVPKPHLRGANNGMSGRTGPSNPNWRGGHTPERQLFYESQEWKNVSRLLRKRDKHVCRRCGRQKTGRKSLHIHHIRSWAEYPDLRTTLSNLVLLCKECHNWVHSNLNTNMEWIGNHA
jgi:5-methylcytosine-specific restriction endonuclease McrA